MPGAREIEKTFLQFLQGDSSAHEISKNVQDFSAGDWQELLDLSFKKRLFPAFYVRLSNLNLKNIPPAVLLRSKNLYLDNLKKNIILQRELFKILAVFKESNIPVIPLKGPVFAIYLYGDLALRQASSDLDLLINQEKIGYAEDILVKFGFHADERTKAGFYEFNGQIHFTRKPSGKEVSIVDLHWSPRNKLFPSHSRDLWSNARRIKVEGNEILFPSKEDLALYLATISIFDGGFVQVKYLYDMHMLASGFTEEINWQDLISKAKLLNMDTALFFTLKLCKEFFHTEIPKEKLYSLKPSYAKERLLGVWMNEKNILKCRNSVVSNFTWSYFISPFLFSRGIFDYIRLVYRRIFRPMREVMWIEGEPLSRASYSLYLKRLLKPIPIFSKKLY